MKVGEIVQCKVLTVKDREKLVLKSYDPMIHRKIIKESTEIAKPVSEKVESIEINNVSEEKNQILENPVIEEIKPKEIKYHPAVEPKIKNFEIIGIVKSEHYTNYLILIDDKMSGWYISEFHINHQYVPKSFLGKKFYEITTDFII